MHSQTDTAKQRALSRMLCASRLKRLKSWDSRAELGPSLVVSVTHCIACEWRDAGEAFVAWRLVRTAWNGGGRQAGDRRQ